MSISLAVTALKLNAAFAGAALDKWQNEQDLIAKKVAAVRRYIAGDHPADLTPQMRKMLRIPADGVFNELTANYMDIVVQTLSDRLQVASIDADNDNATRWAADQLMNNRFDEMQGDVTEATIGDGNTYLLISFDNNLKEVVFTHEPAFDGDEGMLVFYRTRSEKVPSAAIKIWKVAGADGDDTRVNVYYSDRVEKYIARGGEFSPFTDGGETHVAAWVRRDKTPLGMPVVHFRNRQHGYSHYGDSEIVNAIPLQNMLNRNLYSMTMASELSAFQIRYAIGFAPPPEVTPGMWLTISPEEPPDKNVQLEVGTLEGGAILPYLDMARYYAGEIGKITRTPAPEFGSADASGEALKQRESGLLGKVRRLQPKIGNCWELVMTLAAGIQGTFGTADAPTVRRWSTVWHDAEIRNDKMVIDNAVSVADRISERSFLRIIAPVFGFVDTDIERILNERQAATAQRVTDVLASTQLNLSI